MDIVTHKMLEGLPSPVRRYIAYTGVVGKPIVRTVHLKQVGKIRASADKPWMKLDAEEYYTIDPPGFAWIGTVRKMGLPFIRARDSYQNGQGRMLVKFGGLVTLTDATGMEMDQGAMMRYLNEMIWFPSAFLKSNISFEPINDNSATVTLTDCGKTAQATMHFDDVGRVTDFVALRYREVKGKYELETWSTPISEYGEFEGLRLPVKGSAVWKLKEGDLEYISLTVTELRYDVRESD
jgi:hypothetical protein